jgi:MFS transporter, DHA1 family, inner membrane transport protein
MAVFSNDAINRTYVHSALQAFAESGGGVFIFVYLLKSGVPTPLVFCSIAAIWSCRFLTRPGVLPLARRIGLRNALILGTAVVALSYPLLVWVDGLGPMLGAYIAVESLGSVIYWTCYHAYVAARGDADHRGRQVSVTEALSALAGVAAPLAGSLAILLGGPSAIFCGAAFVQALAMIPLIGAPDVDIPRDAPIDRPTRRFAFSLFFAEGLKAASAYFVWQIVLFVTLDEAFGTYGGAMALAGLFGASASQAIGRFIDLGHGGRSLTLACGMTAVVLVIKATALSIPWAAVLANALGAMVSPIAMPVVMTPLYNLAQKSPCPLRFHMASEGGFDMGCAAGCLAAAAASSMGLASGLPIALGLVGVGGVFALLRPRYRKALRAC